MISVAGTSQEPHFLPAEDAKAQTEDFKTPCEPLSQFINKFAERIENEDRPARIARKAKIYRNHAYYRDQQSGTYSPVLDRWVQSEDDTFRSVNFVRQFVDRVVKNFEESKTEIKVRSRSPKENKVTGARAADEIAKCAQEQLFTALFRQREAKYCKLSGEYYRYIYWDESAGPLKEVPKLELQTVSIGQESWECGCGASGGLEDTYNGMCPGCGSSDLSVVPPPQANIQVKVGVSKVPAGDWVLEQPDPLEIDLPLHGRTLKEALWLRRKRLLPRELIKAKFPKLKFISGASPDITLTWQRQLETSPGANTNDIFSSITTSDDYAVFEQVWLAREMYLDWESPRNEKLASGAELQKGEKLIDKCPDGLYFARVNGHLVDIRNENKNDHWAMGVNIVIPGNIHGDGIEDLIGLQDLSNDLHSLMIQYLMRSTCPPLLYDQETIKLEEFPNEPGMSVPVQLFPGQSLEQVAFQLQPAALPGEVPGYMEATKRNMLELAGAFSLDAGAPDVDNKTARAAQLTHDSAQALNGLVLALKAEVDVCTITQALNLAKKYWDTPRYMPLLGDVGEIEIKEYKASDIPEDIIIFAVPGSWKPRTQTEQREDLVNLMQLGLLDPSLPKEIRRYAFQCFNIPIDLESQAIDEALAQTKLEKIKQAFEIVVQEGLPEQIIPQFLLQQIPVKPFVDDPEIGIATIAKFLKSDEGQAINPILDATLTARIQEYMQLGVQQQQFMQMQQLAANAPMAAAAQPPPNQNPKNSDRPQPGTKAGNQ